MKTAYMQLDSGTIIATDTPEIWKEAKRLPDKEGRERLKAEQLDKLRKWYPKGSTVFTILRNVSRSGMQRQISVVCLEHDATRGMYATHPNFAVATVLGRRLARGGGSDSIICNGCGMDMGFDLVYSLANALYGDGYALKQEWL